MSAAPWITDQSAALPSARTRNVKTRGGAGLVARHGIVTRALVRTAVFVFVSSVSYGFFSLMGHSLQSSAYKARTHAELRTESARQDVLEVGRQLSALVSTESLDRWARIHGFSRPGGLMAANYVSEHEQKVQ